MEDGGEATALIRMSLALAWSSSLAALDRALVRRLQRGEALRDLLRAGRAPTHAALGHWAFGERETQLAFAELVAPPAVEASPDASRTHADDLRGSAALLAEHLGAVHSLRRRLRDHVDADARARAAAILTLARSHADRRIVVFARHTETIRALHRALRAEPGVVAITGRQVSAAAGRWTRDEMLDAIGPRAPALDERDPRAIRILLATDLLAEGVEMSGVGILVHADLPWTPARLTQRRGRIARPGGSSALVLETNFVAPAEARAIVQMGSRLRRKRRAGLVAVHGASVRSRLASLMREWAALDETERVAFAIAETRGFVATVRMSGAALLVVGRQIAPGTPWRLTTRAPTCLRVCASVVAPDASGVPARAHAIPPGDEGPVAVRDARRRLARFISRLTARELLGGSRLRPGDALARLSRRIEAAISRARTVERVRLAELQRRLLALAATGRSAALDADVASLLREDLEGPALAGRLERLLEGQRVIVRPAQAQRPRLVALLILRPAAPLDAEAPPAAAHSSIAPGSAVPR
jgi:predicted secreted protein